MVQAMTTVDVDEDDALCASRVACDVADTWVEAMRSGIDRASCPEALCRALDTIELATRESRWRYSRPGDQ